MNQVFKTMVLVLLCAAGLSSIAPTASTQQPKDKGKKPGAPPSTAETKVPPKVVVISNVQLNIATSLNLGTAAGSAPATPARKTDSKDTSPSDLLPALEKASERGAGVVVLSNVKVDIATSLNLGRSESGAVSPAKAAKAEEKPRNDKKNDKKNEKKNDTKNDKKPVPTAAAGAANSGSAGKPADRPIGRPAEEDLFEFHVRLRRTAGGIDVLLAGTTPSANDANVTAAYINQIKDHGMIGLMILPAVLKTKPDTSRALQAAWGSFKAEASGARLSLTALIPHETAAAVGDVADASRALVRSLLGQK